MTGPYTSLDRIRHTIAEARKTIARLSAAGIEPQEYGCDYSQDESHMSNAIIAVRVWKQRYAHELTEFCSRPGPRLPGAVATVWRKAA